MITQVKFWNKVTHLYDLAALPIIAAGDFWQVQVTYQNNLATSHSMSVLYRPTYTDNAHEDIDSGPLGTLAPGESVWTSYSEYAPKPVKSLYVALWANGTMLDNKEFVAGAASPPPPPPPPVGGLSWLIPAAIGSAIVGLALWAKRKKK